MHGLPQIPTVILPALISLALAGCGTQAKQCHGTAKTASNTPQDFAPFTFPPKARIGCLPYTGVYTLFKPADPDHLGHHSYQGVPLTDLQETRRGVMYTRYGGFIDIAHMRKTIDWTAYHYVRFKHALENQWACITLHSKEPSRYHISFNYPDGWGGLPDEQRKLVIDELSLRMAQRLAITQTTWHEIITWYGYTSTPLPEKPSAFSYDDTTAHILGAHVAGIALRDKTRPYDAAVTAAIESELHRLGAVPTKETFQAIKAVKGGWWADGRLLKRQYDIGESGGVEAWVVPGSLDGDTRGPEVFEIPTLADVCGHDMRHFDRIEIQANIFQWHKIRAQLPDRPTRCNPEAHFPVLMDHIRSHARPPQAAESDRQAPDPSG